MRLIIRSPQVQSKYKRYFYIISYYLTGNTKTAFTRCKTILTQSVSKFLEQLWGSYSQSSGGPQWLKNWTNGQNNTTCLLVWLDQKKMTFLKFSYGFPEFWTVKTFRKQGKICNLLSLKSPWMKSFQPQLSLLTIDIVHCICIHEIMLHDCSAVLIRKFMIFSYVSSS